MLILLGACTPKPDVVKNNTDVVIPASVSEFSAAETEDNLWRIIAAKYSLEGYDNRQLNGHIRWFVKNPDYLTRITKRATPYLYFVVQQVQAANLPIEIALLPIVESAYYPFAYSPSGASGLWQFIPSTAKLYGLQENWWQDQRRNVQASTKAAILYLKNLNILFKGDWLLAIAAYNSGPGRVQKAIIKNQKLGKKTDFWHLSLPRETRGYVPRLLAVSKLIKDPHLYGQNITAIANKPQLRSVALDAQIDLALVAQWTGLSMADIYTFNPGLKRWATPKSTRFKLLLPIHKIAQFKHHLSQNPKHSRISWLRHKINAGESLNYLAAKFKTSVKQLMHINKLANHKIIAGKYIIVPIAQKSLNYYTLSDKQREKQRVKLQKNGFKVIYTTKRGDSLWKIAKQHNSHIIDLLKWNRISSKTPLQIGQKLLIWQPHPLSKKQLSKITNTGVNINRKLTYTVRSGDNLSTIANKFNTRVGLLKKWNKLNGAKPLHSGQKLKIIINVVNSDMQ